LSIQYYFNDIELSKSYADQCLQLAEKNSSKSFIADAYYVQGIYYLDKADNLKALDYFKKAVQLKEEANDRKKRLGQIYVTIGGIFSEMQKYPESIDYNNKALKIYRTIQNNSGIATCLNNIGVIYNSTTKYDEAKRYFDESLEYAKKDNFKQQIGSTYSNLGMVASNQGNNDLALKYYNQAVEIHTEINNQRSLAITYNNIGAILQEQKKYHQALDYNQKSLAISKELEDLDGIGLSLANAGNLLTLLKQYDTARKYLNEAVLATKEAESYYDLSQTYAFLHDLDSTQGNYKQALYYYKQHIAYRDSVFNDENKEKLVEQQVQYDFDKKEAAYQYEQQLNAEELKNKKTTIVALVIGLFALILAAGLWYVSARRKQAQKESFAQQQFSQQLLETTEEERGRIARDLHDGVNQELLLLKRELFMQPENALASEKVDNVIKEIRHISRNLHPVMLDSIGLRLAVETLCEQYMESTDVFITYDIEYNDSLTQNAELQVFRVIQEAMTNTLKYANAKACRVEINDTNGSFFLKIQDNGTGFDVQKSLDSGKSFGLNSVIQRAKVIGAIATIESSEKGTVIEIKK
jgi:signal transduction histidine kinase